MPTVEGSMRTGWFVLFSADETKRIAQGVSDYGSPIAALSTFIPEPYVSKVIAAGAAVLTFFAKNAAQKDRALGLYVRGAIPYRVVYKNYWQVVRRSSDASRKVYAIYSQLCPFCSPFVYREEDPQSLESWRMAFAMLGKDLFLTFVCRLIGHGTGMFIARGKMLDTGGLTFNCQGMMGREAHLDN